MYSELGKLQACAARKVDMVEVGLNLAVILVAIYPYFFITFSIFANVDPMYNCATQFFPGSTKPAPLTIPTLINKIIFFSIRLAIQLPTAIQDSRVYGLGCCVLLISGKEILRGIYKLGTNNVLGVICDTRYGRSRRIFLYYARIHLVTQMLHDVLSNTICVVLGSGFVISVAATFSTIRLHHVIPMPFFLLCPATSGLLGLILVLLFEMTIAPHNAAKELMKKWKLAILRSHEKKYLETKLTSIRVILWTVRIGNLRIFNLKNSTRTLYYTTIADTTINALVSSSK